MTRAAARENVIRVLERALYVLAVKGQRRFSEPARVALWKTMDRTARKWEPAFRRDAARAFESDKREILAILSAAKKAALDRKASIDWQRVMGEIRSYLSGASQAMWRKVFLPAVEGLVTDQGEKWAARLGMTFDVQNLRARDWFNRYVLTFAQPINDTTEREIAQIMARAQADGASVPQVQRQLEATFERYVSGKTPADPEWQWYTDRMPPYRTEMIARTETIRASNNGTNGLFKDWGVRRKEWLSTKDDRVRDDHLEADGQVVLMDEKFSVGGEALEYPGDPAGSPGNTINCRCTELPVLEDEAAPVVVEPEGPQIVPEFTTTKEAEEWALNNLINPDEIRYNQLNIERGYAPIKIISYRGLAPEIANTVNATIADLYSKGMPKLNRIITKPMKTGNWAARMSTLGHLEINSTQMGSLKKWNEIVENTNLQYSEKARGLYDELLARESELNPVQRHRLLSMSEHFKYTRFNVGDGIGDMITHEMGHHWDNKMRRSEVGDKYDLALHAALMEQSGEQYKYRLSEYAFSNPFQLRYEVLAESFTAYERGEHQVLSPAMLALFREYWR